MKNLLVNAADAPYIKYLRDCVTGFVTCSTRDILQYLYRTYGPVTPAQLSANDESFRAPYDGSTDLEAYFNGIEDCRAVVGGRRMIRRLPTVVLGSPNRKYGIDIAGCLW